MCACKCYCPSIDDTFNQSPSIECPICNAGRYHSPKESYERCPVCLLPKRSCSSNNSGEFIQGPCLQLRCSRSNNRAIQEETRCRPGGMQIDEFDLHKRSITVFNDDCDHVDHVTPDKSYSYNVLTPSNGYSRSYDDRFPRQHISHNREGRRTVNDTSISILKGMQEPRPNDYNELHNLDTLSSIGEIKHHKKYYHPLYPSPRSSYNTKHSPGYYQDYYDDYPRSSGQYHGHHVEHRHSGQHHGYHDDHHHDTGHHHGHHDDHRLPAQHHGHHDNHHHQTAHHQLKAEHHGHHNDHRHSVEHHGHHNDHRHSVEHHGHHNDHHGGERPGHLNDHRPSGEHNLHHNDHHGGEHHGHLNDHRQSGEHNLHHSDHHGGEHHGHLNDHRQSGEHNLHHSDHHGGEHHGHHNNHRPSGEHNLHHNDHHGGENHGHHNDHHGGEHHGHHNDHRPSGELHEHHDNHHQSGEHHGHHEDHHHQTAEQHGHHNDHRQSGEHHGHHDHQSGSSIHDDQIQQKKHYEGIQRGRKQQERHPGLHYSNPNMVPYSYQDYGRPNDYNVYTHSYHNEYPYSQQQQATRNKSDNSYRGASNIKYSQPNLGRNSNPYQDQPYFTLFHDLHAAEHRNYQSDHQYGRYSQEYPNRYSQNSRRSNPSEFQEDILRKDVVRAKAHNKSPYSDNYKSQYNDNRKNVQDDLQSLYTNTNTASRSLTPREFNNKTTPLHSIQSSQSLDNTCRNKACHAMKTLCPHKCKEEVVNTVDYPKLCDVCKSNQACKAVQEPCTRKTCRWIDLQRCGTRKKTCEPDCCHRCKMNDARNNSRNNSENNSKNMSRRNSRTNTENSARTNSQQYNSQYNSRNNSQYNSRNNSQYNSRNNSQYNSRNNSQYNSRNNSQQNSKNNAQYNSNASHTSVNKPTTPPVSPDAPDAFSIGNSLPVSPNEPSIVEPKIQRETSGLKGKQLLHSYPLRRRFRRRSRTSKAK